MMASCAAPETMPGSQKPTPSKMRGSATLRQSLRLRAGPGHNHTVKSRRAFGHARRGVVVSDAPPTETVFQVRDLAEPDECRIVDAPGDIIGEFTVSGLGTATIDPAAIASLIDRIMRPVRGWSSKRWRVTS